MPGGICTHEHINVSMECYFFCLGDPSNPPWMYHLFLEASPVERKALRNALDSGFCVFIWTGIRGTVLPIPLSKFIVRWMPTPKILAQYSVIAQFKNKEDKRSQAYQGTLAVVSRTIF
jgi:hypothetical protein